MRHKVLASLLQSLGALLDSGEYDDISVEEVEDRIRDGSVLRFLEKRAGNDRDFSLFTKPTKTYGDFEAFYVNYLRGILHSYGGDGLRKWGIKNRGLCLLIAWTSETLGQGHDWSANSDIASVDNSLLFD